MHCGLSDEGQGKIKTWLLGSLRRDSTRENKDPPKKSDYGVKNGEMSKWVVDLGQGDCAEIWYDVCGRVGKSSENVQIIRWIG